MNIFNNIFNQQKNTDDVVKAATLKTPGSISSEGINKESSLMAFFEDVVGSSETLLAKIETPIISVNSGLSSLLSSAKGFVAGKTKDFIDSGMDKITSSASTIIEKISKNKPASIISKVSPLESPLTSVQKKISSKGSLLSGLPIPNSLERVTNTKIFKEIQSNVTKTIMDVSLKAVDNPIASIASKIYSSIKTSSIFNNPAAIAEQIPGEITAEKIAQNSAYQKLSDSLKAEVDKLISSIDESIPSNPFLKFQDDVELFQEKSHNIAKVLDSDGKNIEIDNLEAALASLPDFSLGDITKASENDSTIFPDLLCLVTETHNSDNIADTFANAIGGEIFEVV